MTQAPVDTDHSTTLPSTRYGSADARLFRLSRPNVLLIGPDADLDAAITAITGCDANAVPSWSRQLQAACDPTPATVLIRNVMALDTADQHQLNQWLDQRVGDVRVIATTPEPMYGLVEREQFLEALYYRLNVVSIELGQMERAGRLF